MPEISLDDPYDEVSRRSPPRRSGWERCYNELDAADATACFQEYVATGEIDETFMPVALRFPECGYAEVSWSGDLYSMSDADFVAAVEAARPCFLALVDGRHDPGVRAADRDRPPRVLRGSQLVQHVRRHRSTTSATTPASTPPTAPDRLPPCRGLSIAWPAMKTRTLLLLALACGVAIMAAGAVFLVQLSRQADAAPPVPLGEATEVGDMRVVVDEAASTTACST